MPPEQTPVERVRTRRDERAEGRTGGRPATSSMPEHRMILLVSLVALLVFAVACTLLGLEVAKTARPCPAGCPVLSRAKLLVWMVVGGPGLLSAVAVVWSLLRFGTRPSRAWVPAVLGCFASLVVVLVGSMVLGVA